MGGYSPNTLNRAARESVRDRGVIKILPLPISLARTDANPPALLTGATTPKHVNTGGVNTIQWAGASATASIVVQTTLPWDYATGITSSGKPVHGSLILGYTMKKTGNADDASALYFGATINAINPYDPTKIAFDGTTSGTWKRYTSATAAAFVKGDSTNVLMTGGLTAVAPYERCEIDFTEIFGASNAILKAGAALSISISGSTTGSDQYDLASLYIAYRANSSLSQDRPYR